MAVSKIKDEQNQLSAARQEPCTFVYKNAGRVGECGPQISTDGLLSSCNYFVIRMELSEVVILRNTVFSSLPLAAVK